MQSRRKFIKSASLVASSVFAVDKMMNLKSLEPLGNHHTVHWFNNKGKIIRIEKISTASERTCSITENINRREEVLKRLK